MDGNNGVASRPWVAPQKFQHIPYNRRWEPLKPIIQRFYVEERYTFADLAIAMKDLYSFDASERQYKYHCKVWGFGKSVTDVVKEEACTALGKRMRGHNSTPIVEYKGQEIEKTKLKRYLITKAKQDEALTISSKTFLTWNLPYAALRASRMGVNDFSSPFGPSRTPSSTPHYLSILSPSGYSPRKALSPAGSAASPHDAPTPTMTALRQKEKADRVKLLVQGRHDELLSSMSKGERKIVTTWLYQFWLFSYKTAKHWGHGPEDWSGSVLRFTDFEDIATAVNTPMPHIAENEVYDYQDQSEPLGQCYWSIHVTSMDILGVQRAAPLRRQVDDYEASDERDWPEWGHRDVSSVEKLQKALKNNTFSNVDPQALPISLAEIAKSAEKSPDHLLMETVGFAIMARNEALLWELVGDKDCQDFECLEPYHLAASYLCGANTCCNVLDFINSHFSNSTSAERLYVDHQGHTVLDTLMMGILKSHTGCSPHTVNQNLAAQKRWTGEELDICGRWDADSPCVRKLLAKGKSTIPVEWKHMFCHTSAQSLCHSIGTIFGTRFAPPINTTSGLFKRSCTCGRQLELQPLHTLVMIAFHLAHNGRPGENLFGILACLSCLLANGADPLKAAHLSVDKLLGSDICNGCSHALLDPYELAKAIPEEIITHWPGETKLGWKVFCEVLAFAQRERLSGNGQTAQRSSRKSRFRKDFGGMVIDDDDDSDDDHSDTDVSENSEDGDYGMWCAHRKESHENFYSGSKELGKLWAAIQTELLTYRKIEEDDKWLSDNFIMEELLAGLESGLGCSLLPLVDRKMMNPICQCGRFRKAHDEACVMVQEASRYYFANNDIWARATYIVLPEYRRDLWYDDSDYDDFDEL